MASFDLGWFHQNSLQAFDFSRDDLFEPTFQNIGHLFSVCLATVLQSLSLSLRHVTNVIISSHPPTPTNAIDITWTSSGSTLHFVTTHCCLCDATNQQVGFIVLILSFFLFGTTKVIISWLKKFWSVGKSTISTSSFNNIKFAI